MNGRFLAASIAVAFLVLAVSSSVALGSDSDGADAGSVFGSMYDPVTGTVELEGEVVLTATVVVDSGTLCIHGTGTITRSSGFGHIFSVSGTGSKLIIGGNDDDAITIDGKNSSCNFSAISVSGEGSTLILGAGTTVSGFINGGSSTTTEVKGNGAAVHAVDKSTVYIQGAVLSGNTGYRGGSVFVKDSVLEMTSGHICSSKGNMGGGMYVNNSNVTIRGGVIGGSSYFGDILNSYVSEYDSDQLPLCQGNNANSGGGIFTAYGSVVTISGDASVAYNTAFAAGAGMVYGGGVYANGGSEIILEENGAIAANVVLCDKNIEPNKSDGAYGGGIFIEKAKISMTGGSISYNMAIGLNAHGGGIRMLDSASVMKMSGGTVSHNSSSVNGGGISVYNGTLEMEGGSVVYNTAGLRTYGGHSGGPNIIVDNDPEVYSSDMNIGSGPGIYAFGLDKNVCKVTITGGSISDNIGSSDGKDLCIAHSSDLRLTDGAVDSIFILNSISGTPSVSMDSGYRGEVEFSGGKNGSGTYSAPVMVSAASDTGDAIDISYNNEDVKCSTHVENVYDVTILPGDHGVSSKQVLWNIASGSVMPSIVVDGEPGYTIAGWDPALPETVTASDTYTAIWAINQYTISFDTDGGSAVDAISQDYGTSVTAPADPTRTGHTFAGWDTEIPISMPAGDITITATWTVDQYAVNYDSESILVKLDGAEVTPGGKVAYGSIITVTAEERTGYTGVLTADVGELLGASYSMGASDVEFTVGYTINEYTITFDTDGGSVVAAIIQDFGTAVISPAAPTKTGCTFAGWDTEMPETMPAGDVTITATWTVNQYTITFDTDGGSAVDAISQDYGTAVTAPAAPTKTGCTFAGWDTEIPETMPAEDVTITAAWTQTAYTVTLVGAGFSVQMGGVGLTDASVMHSGDTVSITVESGYSVAVDGLAANADGTYAVYGDVSVTSTYHAPPSGGSALPDIPLVPGVTVTYDTSVGSVPSSSTVVVDGVVVLPDAPFADGYTFDGWSVGGGVMSPGDRVVITKDTTISAIWTETKVEDIVDEVPTGSSQVIGLADVTKYIVPVLLLIGGLYIVKREIS